MGPNSITHKWQNAKDMLQEISNDRTCQRENVRGELIVDQVNQGPFVLANPIDSNSRNLSQTWDSAVKEDVYGLATIEVLEQDITRETFDLNIAQREGQAQLKNAGPMEEIPTANSGLAFQAQNIVGPNLRSSTHDHDTIFRFSSSQVATVPKPRIWRKDDQDKKTLSLQSRQATIRLKTKEEYALSNVGDLTSNEKRSKGVDHDGSVIILSAGAAMQTRRSP
ncbi:hypothetical protein SLE2022_374330 [Rubroshorea leprosula]